VTAVRRLTRVKTVSSAAGTKITTASATILLRGEQEKSANAHAQIERSKTGAGSTMSQMVTAVYSGGDSHLSADLLPFYHLMHHQQQPCHRRPQDTDEHRRTSAPRLVHNTDEQRAPLRGAEVRG